MKKLLAFIAVLSVLYFSASLHLIAQDAVSIPAAQTASGSVTKSAEPDTVEQIATPSGQNHSIHQVLKQKFIEGGPGFMTPILICLILGLAIALERIVSLNLASLYNKKLLEKINQALKTGGVEAAKQICKNTQGPVASIFYHGLARSEEGLDVVEKTVVAHGEIQTSSLEKGLVWIALFIALGPMLGFLGTVIGMIQIFDAVEIAGDIRLALILSGLKVALITTIGGLIVSMILQVFYNYCVSKIDTIVNCMEDDSIALIDLLVKYHHKR